MGASLLALAKYIYIYYSYYIAEDISGVFNKTLRHGI